MQKKYSLFSLLRGIFYILLYRLRYLPILYWKRFTKITEVVRLTIGTVTYSLRVKVHEGGLDEDIYVCSIREYPNVHYFQKYIRKHGPTIETFIDLGSNIGYYAILTAKTINQFKSKNKKIICVEPVKSTYNLLQQNLSINNLSHITSLNYAVGDKNQKQTMIVTKEKNLSRISQIHDHGIGTHPSSETIQMITPETLFKKYVIPQKNVLIRCDIEGYEYQLFVNNKNFIKKLTNAHIIMELHPYYLGSKKTIELLQTLESAGFTLNQTISCEPLYFLKMPRVIRKLLRQLFLMEYNGEILGKLTKMKTISDICKALKNPKHALYHYPNLHLYLSK